MNGKRAKRIRRMAEAYSVGQPDRAYQRDPRGPNRLIETCTRAVYQRIKRELGRWTKNTM